MRGPEVTKKQCVCGYKSFSYTKKATHVQAECRRCNRVYAMFKEKGKVS